MKRRRNAANPSKIDGDEGRIYFRGTPLPKDVSLVISHNVEWSVDRERKRFDYYYNRLDYQFEQEEIVVSCRSYIEDDLEVGIGQPMRRLSEFDFSPVEWEPLMMIAVRYFGEREFQTIKVFETSGYVRLKPEHTYMQVARR